jgi:hypothetical protein
MKLDNRLIPGVRNSADTSVHLYRPRVMKQLTRHRQEGKIGWIFLWLIGVPVPLLLVFFLLRGCT